MHYIIYDENTTNGYKSLKVINRFETASFSIPIKPTCGELTVQTKIKYVNISRDIISAAFHMFEILRSYHEEDATYIGNLTPHRNKKLF